MNYVGWAVVALLAYTLVAPLMKVATQSIPSEVAAFVSNLVLVAVALVIALRGNHHITDYVTHPKSPYMYAAGACLAVGILAYYRALSMGPISIVTPVFGLFLVTSSVLGVVLLDEPFTARKLVGVGFAILAVYFTTVE
ncbi:MULTISPECIES: EamA family transporter [Halostella]|uniref:EamA family transporter n=1 Tax=Halostella TaxID=1843185 RepID=UPI0010805CC0|nr:MULTISPECIES: EamA family transporter [Halostella]